MLRLAINDQQVDLEGVKFNLQLNSPVPLSPEDDLVEGSFAFWQPTVYGGITAGIAYLLKNVLTNSEDNIGKGEPV